MIELHTGSTHVDSLKPSYLRHLGTYPPRFPSRYCADRELRRKARDGRSGLSGAYTGSTLTY
jgi:hypothetical protein